MISYKCNCCGNQMYNCVEPIEIKIRHNDSEFILFEMIPSNIRLFNNDGALIRNNNVHICKVCIVKILSKLCVKNML